MCIDEKLLVVNTDIDAFQIDIGGVRIKGFSMETTLLRISDDLDVGSGRDCRSSSSSSRR